VTGESVPIPSFWPAPPPNPAQLEGLGIPSPCIWRRSGSGTGIPDQFDPPAGNQPFSELWARAGERELPRVVSLVKPCRGHRARWQKLIVWMPEEERPALASLPAAAWVARAWRQPAPSMPMGLCRYDLLESGGVDQRTRAGCS